MNDEPDYNREMLAAIVLYSWKVEIISMYEEGVEGWIWTDHTGRTHIELGSWDELPPWPWSAHEAFLEKERGT